MPLELPQGVMGKLHRALRPFIEAEVDIEALVMRLVVMPTVSRRQYGRILAQAHAVVDRAVGEALADVDAMTKLAYVRGARLENPDYKLSNVDQGPLEDLEGIARQNLMLAHVALDRRLSDVMRRVQLVNVARTSKPTEATAGLLGTMDARGMPSRAAWSFQQHARAGLATVGAAAFSTGIGRTRNQPLYGV